MSIVEEKYFKEFMHNAFMIMADLRDYSYDAKTLKYCCKLWKNMSYLVEIYTNEQMIDKKIARELMTFSIAIFDCRFNIIAKKKEIESIACKFNKYRDKILDESYNFVSNEKDKSILDSRYDRVLELELECWDYSCGENGFISLYQQTKTFEVEKGYQFNDCLKEIAYLSNQIGLFTKNTVRILCNVYDFFCELMGTPAYSKKMDIIYSEFIDISIGV